GSPPRDRAPPAVCDASSVPAGADGSGVTGVAGGARTRDAIEVRARLLPCPRQAVAGEKSRMRTEPMEWFDMDTPVFAPTHPLPSENREMRRTCGASLEAPTSEGGAG